MYQINSEVIVQLPFFPRTKRRRNLAETPDLLDSIVVADSQYTVRFARDARQINELLRLRFQVFNGELGGSQSDFFAVEKEPISLFITILPTSITYLQLCIFLNFYEGTKSWIIGKCLLLLKFALNSYLL